MVTTDDLPITRRCPIDRDAEGIDRRQPRLDCAHCQREVVSLSAMTAGEALAFVAAARGRGAGLCVSYRVGAGGRIVFAEESSVRDLRDLRDLHRAHVGRAARSAQPSQDLPEAPAAGPWVPLHRLLRGAPLASTTARAAGLALGLGACTPHVPASGQGGSEEHGLSSLARSQGIRVIPDAPVTDAPVTDAGERVPVVEEPEEPTSPPRRALRQAATSPRATHKAPQEATWKKPGKATVAEIDWVDGYLF